MNLVVGSEGQASTRDQDQTRESGAMSTRAGDILELSIAERMQIVEDIWDSIAAVPEAVPLSEELKKELDRRLEAYHLNPDAGSPWLAVRERLRSGQQKNKIGPLFSFLFRFSMGRSRSKWKKP